MKIAKAIALLWVIVSAANGPSAAQVFGQLAGCGPAAEGEGALFMLAGNGAFRTGASGRFNVSGMSDFGIQLGIDRVAGESFFGGGVDFRLVVLKSRAELPLSLALDASLGGLDSGDVRRFLFGFGICAGGMVKTASWRTIEPYCSFIVGLEQIDGRSPESADPGECYTCSRESGENETYTEFRAGVEIPLTHDTQVLFEMGLEDEARFGAAFNVVF